MAWILEEDPGYDEEPGNAQLRSGAPEPLVSLAHWRGMTKAENGRAADSARGAAKTRSTLLRRGVDGKSATTCIGVTLGASVGIFNVATPPEH